MSIDNHFSNAQRAEVLTQALPYIKKYSGKIIVVKYGGNAMINQQLKEQVMEDIALLWLIGVKVVLVHGGGPEINDVMGKLGKQPEFVDGLRVTDKETVDIVQMVLAGKVNKSLVTRVRSPRSVPSPSRLCWKSIISPWYPPWPAISRATCITSTATPPLPTLQVH